MIIGKRIRLRAVEKEDLPLFVQWLNDPEIIAGLMMYTPLSVADENRWFEKIQDHIPEERPLAIEILQENSWRLAGNSEFHEISLSNHSAEIGIFIGDKSIWDLGYGTEAMQLLLKHGFESLNLHRIFLRVYETNLRAIHVYEKVGFIHEGRLRQARYKNGKYMDELFMGILRSEWEAKRLLEE